MVKIKQVNANNQNPRVHSYDIHTSLVHCVTIYSVLLRWHFIYYTLQTVEVGGIVAIPWYIWAMNNNR